MSFYDLVNDLVYSKAWKIYSDIIFRNSFDVNQCEDLVSQEMKKISLSILGYTGGFVKVYVYEFVHYSNYNVK